MEVLIIRKYLLALFLSSMCQCSIGQCPTSLPNMVLRVGDDYKFTHPINRKCAWSLMPSNSFYNSMKKVTDSVFNLLPDFAGALLPDLSGLTIKASITPVEGANWTTAGLYVMQDKEANCNSSAKVLVIESGPTCECSASKKGTPARYSCTVVYADSPAIPMNPQITWSSANGKHYVTDVPLPRRIDLYRYRVESVMPMRSKGKMVGLDWIPKSCTLTFMAPPYRRFPSIAREAPAFSETCSFNKCD